MPHRHIETYKNCTDCQNMVRMGAGVRLLEHLKHFHQHNDKIAHDIVNWVFLKIAEIRFKIANR